MDSDDDYEEDDFLIVDVLWDKENNKQSMKMINMTRDKPLTGINPISHTKKVTRIILSKAREVLYTSSVDGSIKIWSALKYCQIGVLFESRKPVLDIDLSTDERSMAVAIKNEPFFILEIDENLKISNKIISKTIARIVRISKNSEYLVSDSGTSIIISKYNPNVVLNIFDIQHDQINILHFANDYNHILASNGNKVITIDIKQETLKEIPIYALTVIAPGNYSTFFGVGLKNYNIKLFDLADENYSKNLGKMRSFATSMAFSQSDEYLVVSSYDKCIRIIEISSNKSRVISFKTSPILFVMDSDLTRIYYTLTHFKGENLLNLYDLEADKKIEGFHGHDREIKKITVFQNNVLTDSNDGVLRLWDRQSGKQSALINPKYGISKYCVSDNNKMIAIIFSTKVVLWDLAENKEMFEMSLSEALYYLFFMDYDKILVLHGYNHQIFIDIASKNIVREIRYTKTSIDYSLKIDQNYFIESFFSKFFKVIKATVPPSVKLEVKGFTGGLIFDSVFTKNKKYLIVCSRSCKYSVFKFDY